MSDNEDKGTALVQFETGFVMAPAVVKKRIGELVAYKALMKEGEDYGTIPGTPKPTLYQPGADTLCIAAGLVTGEPMFEQAVEDWETPFFYYRVKQPLLDMEGRVIAWGIGSCNSREDKYAYRWVPTWKMADEDKERAKAEGWRTKWIVSKGKRYLMYRTASEDIYSQVNTLQKMAVKRAYISATLRATGAHRVFTQDVEDMPAPAGEVVEAEYKEVPQEATVPAAAPARSTGGTVPAGATTCPNHPDRVPLRAWSGYSGDGNSRFKIEGRKCTAKDGDAWCSMMLGNDGYWYENVDKSNYRRLEAAGEAPPLEEPEYVPPEEEGLLA